MSFLKNFINKKSDEGNTEETVQNIDNKVYITFGYSTKKIDVVDKTIDGFSDATDEIQNRYVSNQREYISYSTNKDNLIEYSYKHLKDVTIDNIKGIQNTNNNIKNIESLEEKASSVISKFLLSERKEDLLKEKKWQIKILCEHIKNLFNNKLAEEHFIQMIEELESEYPDIFSDLDITS